MNQLAPTCPTCGAAITSPASGPPIPPLSRRDYLAAAALSAVTRGLMENLGVNAKPSVLAQYSVELADALIWALDRERTS